jgi:AraC family transcriptional regulator, regulatory protein of adaptative response / DNA-3-methyladenine glycosylase II
MELDPALCYAASLSKDARFDGRFFVGVLTTEVYCRPICPAPMPKPGNVRFFTSAAAASEAGFRPCLRCCPEASPGTPEWNGSSELVTRALRLIDEGDLHDEGVRGVANRLHVSERHLRRLFIQYLGASPIAVAQTRRLHFAKKLISETTLPMTDVAFSAGFSSIRRFNGAIRETYGRSPSDLRYLSKRIRNGKQPSPYLELKLSYRPPYDWDSIIEFFKARAIPGVEEVEPGCYRRSIRLDGQSGILEVRPIPGRHLLRLRVSPELSSSLMQVVARIRRMFDLGADPEIIELHLSKDPHLLPLVNSRPGLRVPGAWDGFEVAIRAILGQQISVPAATTLAGRLVEAYGEQMNDLGQAGISRIFPAAEALQDASLAEVGLPANRRETIRCLAKSVVDERVDFAVSNGLEDFVDALIHLPGIGSWTAQYIALRLSEPDAFPVGDLGLRRAATEQGEPPISEKSLLQCAEAWRPWRAYAAVHLWGSLPHGGRTLDAGINQTIVDEKIPH